MTTDTLIIGGGLSGLHAASLLHDERRPFLLLDARPHLGGRVRTAHRHGHPFDLGPSWFWPAANPRFARLVETLRLAHYAQHTEGDALLEDSAGQLRRQAHHELDPRHARRLTGGTGALVDALRATLPAELLRTGHRVVSIEHQPTHLLVTAAASSAEHSFAARQVILALPPRLLASTIAFTPALPSALLAALRRIPTWMAGDAKFFAIYDERFWRTEGLSGCALSGLGPLSESHDASLPDGPAALLGFLIPDTSERRARGASLVPQCLAQLARYFGPRAAAPRDTILMDWSHESLTATSQDVPLATHPSYGLPPGALHLWDGRLRFAGTEMAREHGGYLEGALEAAEAALRPLDP